MDANGITMKNTQVKLNAIFSAHTPENELVKHAADGDGEAFRLIMKRHNQRLFRTARSILNNDADAEEALQEAYIRAWQALRTFRHDARLSTWLVRIVVNESLGRLRRKGAQIIPLDAMMNSSDQEVQSALTETHDQLPERVAMRTELRKILEVRIDRLPDIYRTVFVLCAVEEMTTQEVASALLLPEATVRTRLARSRKILRVGLANDIDITLDDAFSFDGERCDRIVETVLAMGRQPPANRAAAGRARRHDGPARAPEPG